MSVGSSIATDRILWYGILIVGDTVGGWGQWVYENSQYFSTQFYLNCAKFTKIKSKTTLKESLKM